MDIETPEMYFETLPSFLPCYGRALLSFRKPELPGYSSVFDGTKGARPRTAGSAAD